MIVGFSKDIISSYSASLVAFAKFNCFWANVFDCLAKNWEGRLSFHSDQSPSSLVLFINPNLAPLVLAETCWPVFGSYQYWPPSVFGFIAAPNGLSGSFFILLKASSLVFLFELIYYI